jgi:hypothetical protein
MRCDRKCYEIGGPWIEADPNCPVHGSGGTEEQERSRESLEERVSILENRVKWLEELLASQPWKK